MKHATRSLQRELTQAGAKPDEAVLLSNLANQLVMLRADQHGARRKRYVLPAVALAAVCALIVVTAQLVLPGNALYPVQKATDNLTVAVVPSYRATIMMKRAQQVQELANNHAPAHAIVLALADYQKEAATYKAHAGDDAAYAACKASLQHAATATSGSVHQAITTTLTSLDTV